jgi:hypothetical protein
MSLLRTTRWLAATGATLSTSVSASTPR